MIIIKEIDYEYYGKLNHLKLKFTEGINLLYGENEAGKTTVIDSIGTLIFGFSKTNKAQHPYTNWKSDHLSFSSKIDCSGELFSVERRLMSVPQLTILNVLDQSVIKKRNDALPWVKGMSKQLYQSIFCFTAEDLSGFESLSWDQIQERLLFNYDVSYLKNPSEIVKRLEQEINSLWRKDKRGNPELNRLKEQKITLYQKKRMVEKDLELLSKLKTSLEEQQNRQSILSVQWNELVIEQKIITKWLSKANHLRSIERLEKLIVHKDIFDSMPKDAINELENRILSQKKKQCVASQHLELSKELYKNLIGHDANEEILEKIRDIDRLKVRELLYSLVQKKSTWGIWESIIGSVGVLALITSSWFNFFMGILLGSLLLVSIGLIVLWKGNKSKQIHLRKLQSYFEHPIPEYVQRDTKYQFFQDFERLKLEIDQWCYSQSELGDSDLEADRIELLSKQFESLGDGNVEKGMKTFESNKHLENQIITLKEILYREGNFQIPFNHDTITEERFDIVQNYLESIQDEKDQLALGIKRLDEEIQKLYTFDDYDQIVSEIQTTEDQIRNITEKRDLLMALKTLLIYSDESFKRKHQPSVIKRVSHYLSLITSGKYQEVYVEEKDQSMMFFLKTQTSIQPLSKAFSKGTIHQLYFAFRIALIEELDPDGTLPLVLDEVFVNWDSHRLLACIPMLEEIACKRQIVISTCHFEVVKHFNDMNLISLSEVIR